MSLTHFYSLNNTPIFGKLILSKASHNWDFVGLSNFLLWRGNLCRNWYSWLVVRGGGIKRQKWKSQTTRKMEKKGEVEYWNYWLDRCTEAGQISVGGLGLHRKVENPIKPLIEWNWVEKISLRRINSYIIWFFKMKWLN